MFITHKKRNYNIKKTFRKPAVFLKYLKNAKTGFSDQIDKRKEK